MHLTPARSQKKLIRILWRSASVDFSQTSSTNSILNRLQFAPNLLIGHGYFLRKKTWVIGTRRQTKTKIGHRKTPATGLKKRIWPIPIEILKVKPLLFSRPMVDTSKFEASLVPRYNKKAGTCSLSFRLAVLWNSFPTEAKRSKSLLEVRSAVCAMLDSPSAVSCLKSLVFDSISTIWCNVTVDSGLFVFVHCYCWDADIK